MKTLTYSLIITSLVLLVGIGYKIINTQTLGGGAGQVASSCTTSTVANATIGTTSSTVLAAHSNRAWARITQVQTTGGVATSTPFLSFNAGAVAVVNSGVTLGTTTPSVDFGRNTDFPYTGVITGIVGNVGGASNASTTVQVTECRY